ncbi:MAG: SDR family NAD(P)-dependent oxidoreductase, partial [Gammaproteobacteria bacterium]|nr:SDR family NAD(P)-dependent oxidoreductase [Gammaproteobacteria bacterium]
MKKVVIVTGGGRGIGAATAKLLAKQGYQVCVNYRVNAKRAQAIVAEIMTAGGQAFSVQADVSCESDVVALFDATERQFGPVTHLVNNAGMLFS